MTEQTKAVFQVINKNLSQLYMFAVSMTSSQKQAERLIQILLAEAKSVHIYPINCPDLKSRLFRLLYKLYSQYERRNNSDNNEDTYEHLEEFYLYNRFEEEHIHDQDQKLACLSLIYLKERETIFANLPLTLRPYI
jgi:hypothetical protein